ncbi:MAG: hypothetical protein HY239_21545 [Mycolicibacterium aromaticivorans]|nr:hypothetical protein [Mycolicibacterium aromaticivorans]
MALLRRNVGVAEFRWNGEFVLVDIDAAPGDPTAPHAQPADCRVGLYGTPALG